ncbi:MAG: DUF1189 domain-containing protein [Clostridia bacterium]|nr:DUF1189 domain-containing protein [Clostridia bacterium]
MEESKLSFWKKIKISIFKFEEYQQLAAQKVGKTIEYLLKLMLIFSLIASIAVTFQFMTQLVKITHYFDEAISSLHFENEQLTVNAKENAEEPIIFEDTDKLNTKILIDTRKIEQSEIEEYTKSMDGYTVGVVVLKDKIILKSNRMAMTSQMPYSTIVEQYNINHLEKQDIFDFLSGRQLFTIGAVFFIVMMIYLFVIYFSTVLLDAILYSILGYIEGIISRIRLRYGAVYNIAIHAMTLPIILNLIYFVVNVLTGFTIQYFQIMYTAITCIYIITAILMIKSDVIKRQMELSKIIEEQERIKQEMARKEQEEKEEQERERLRKEDEKKRQEEKKRERKQNGGQNDTPQPEANFKPSKP